LKTPHLLNASSNCRKLHLNLHGIVDQAALDAIESAIKANVVGLFRLGASHYDFARTAPVKEWRQRVSRFYYAAYNLTRCVRLDLDGEFHEDVTDHKKVAVLPDAFPNRATYEHRLGLLRKDRNLCDYDHTGEEADLMNTVSDTETLVGELMGDAARYLKSRGIVV
jgi:hypothetical protein